MPLKINSVRFNQDSSMVVAATGEGFLTVELHTETASLVYRRNLACSYKLAEQLCRTNIFLLVPFYSSSEVQVWDEKKEEVLSTLEYSEPVVDVLARQQYTPCCTQYYLVQLSKQVFFYNHQLQLTHILSTFQTLTPGSLDLALNPFCLACPGTTEGTVQLLRKIADLDPQQSGTGRPDEYTSDIIETVHDSPLARIKLSPDGSLLATVSCQGTVIKVYNTVAGILHSEFRRGETPACVSSLSFSDDSKYLLLSSDQSTQHIYCLKDQSKNTTSRFSFAASLLSYFGHTWSYLDFIPHFPRTPSTSPLVSSFRRLSASHTYYLTVVSPDLQVSSYALMDKVNEVSHMFAHFFRELW